PVQTRWGSWLLTVLYYHHHFDQAIRFVKDVLGTEAGNSRDEKERIGRLVELVTSNEETIRKDMNFIYDQYCLLPLFITELETRSIPVNQSFAMVKKATDYVKKSTDDSIPKDMADIAKRVYNKMQNLWRKNSGLKDICERVQIDPKLLYSQLVSVPCESLFSLFRGLLNNLGSSISPETVADRLFGTANIVGRRALYQQVPVALFFFC